MVFFFAKSESNGVLLFNFFFVCYSKCSVHRNLFLIYVLDILKDLQLKFSFVSAVSLVRAPGIQMKLFGLVEISSTLVDYTIVHIVCGFFVVGRAP